MSAHGEIVGAGQTARTRAHHGDALAGRWRQLGPKGLRPPQIQVRDVAFDVVDADRLVEQIAATALHLAGPRAHTPADGGQGIAILDQFDGLAELAQRCQSNVPLNVDARRAGVLARPHTVGVVTGEQQFEGRLARLPHLGAVGFDHHAVGDLGGTGGQQGAGALHFDHAHEAGGERFELFVVTQRRDAVDPDRASHF